MPPITRNKTGNKDLQNSITSKESSCNRLAQDLQSKEFRASKNLNRSYITVVSDSESISNDELEMTLDLRNKLAQTEYELSQLKEEKLKLVNLLQGLEVRLDGKQNMIDNLHATIEKLTNNSNNKTILTNVSTQTDELLNCESPIQCDGLLEHEIVKASSERRHSAELTSGTDVFHGPSPVIDSCRTKRVSPRILFLGDSQFRGIAGIADSIFGPSYSIESIFKPNALFEHVIEDVAALTQSFTNSDYVFVCAGTNNVLHGASVNNAKLNNVFSSLTRTNVVFLSVPYWSDKIEYNKLAYQFNCKINDIVCEFDDFMYIDINPLVNNTHLHLNILKKSVEADLMLDIFDAHNVVNLINQPTRISINKFGVRCESAIDCVATDMPAAFVQCCSIEPNLGDHLAQVLDVVVHKEAQRQEDCPLYVGCSSNELRDLFWLKSNELRDLFWLKSRLNSEALNTLYNEKKKLHNKLIVDVKSNYYRAKLNNSSNKTKTLWKVVNDKRKPSHVNKAQKFNINKNGILIDEPGEVSNEFGSYFSTVAGALVDSQLSAVDSSSSAVICDPCPSFLFSSFLLKNIIYELAEHLAYLINSSFAEGRFPDSWKTATVVPIYKRGSQVDVASYRPISILSTFSKVLERAAYDQLMGYLSNHNLICNNQYGFRQQRSTETALKQRSLRSVNGLLIES
ncbi:Reverse transcriptase (RNA-dependent DNA polymerase) [Popillia japonica]|uniref:Reverse transcriptase (RNA-dependent DNA polymerase) n=1 Tax=Popillia japonica TaxID=7064 RepID=A0AAW1IFN1_POPJA